jgi:hypothetical protein
MKMKMEDDSHAHEYDWQVGWLDTGVDMDGHGHGILGRKGINRYSTFSGISLLTYFRNIFFCRYSGMRTSFLYSYNRKSRSPHLVSRSYEVDDTGP